MLTATRSEGKKRPTWTSLKASFLPHFIRTSSPHKKDDSYLEAWWSDKNTRTHAELDTTTHRQGRLTYNSYIHTTATHIRDLHICQGYTNTRRIHEQELHMYARATHIQQLAIYKTYTQQPHTCRAWTHKNYTRPTHMQDLDT